MATSSMARAARPRPIEARPTRVRARLRAPTIARPRATASGEEAREALRAFVKTWVAFRNTMELYFTQFGISGSQWGILRSLHEAALDGEPRLRQTDLADRLLLRPPSITSVVYRMERAGLVIRHAAAEDRRAKEVALTTAGRALTARVLRQHPTQLRAVLGAFSAVEVRMLQGLLERMSGQLNTLVGRRAPLRGAGS